MILVGVRDLKNQLSQYLQFVKNGEKVIITEHNKIIAELSLPRNEAKDSTIVEELQKLSSAGKMILAKRNVSIVPLPTSSVRVDWKEIYSDAREDRF